MSVIADADADADADTNANVSVGTNGNIRWAGAATSNRITDV